MAKQYVITEEEFLSLLESLELHKLRRNNVCETETPTADDLHRGFHYVTVNWIQQMGFTSCRRGA